MRLPRRLNDIIKRKQEFIDLQRNKLEKSVIKMQSKLLDEINLEIISSLDIKNGVIQDTRNNYRLITRLDKVYSEFISFNSRMIVSQFTITTAGIIEFSADYFKKILPAVTSYFDKIALSTIAKINSRVGLEGGKIISGGFLEDVIKDQNTLTELKNYLAKSITGQIDNKDFLSGLTKVVNGDKGPGSMEKQYQRFAYDLYQQYDAAYNNSLAADLEYNYFVYQGGLIEDSRDFCVAHNGKVWTKEEANTWARWTPSDGQYPEGYEIRQKDIYAIPSYLGYPGYDPITDRGGYRCRHQLAWIPDDIAIEMRPELADVNKKT